MEAIEKASTKALESINKENATNPIITNVLKIVREFIETHRVLCYGGTAINNLLKKENQFYDPNVDIPDYDFFSETPQEHAVKLADRIVKSGYKSVEVKPGVHLGTYKVFADFNGVADISHLSKDLFVRLWKDGIEKERIRYVPPNFLRMSIYLELSRPKGDVSRWKKVYSRLLLLNNEYPIDCKKHENSNKYLTNSVVPKIEELLKKEEVILIGFNAAKQQDSGKAKWQLPLDLLATPELFTHIVETFKKVFESSVVKQHPPYEELFPKHADITDSKGNLLVRVYETNACHSYHKTKSGMYLASIPTILQFFFSTLYAPSHFLEDFSADRYICNAQHLMDLASSVRHKFKLLTPITCLGKQETLLDMRKHKSELYSTVSKDRNSREFLEYFFQYYPLQLTKTQRQKTRLQLRKTLRTEP